MCIILWWIVLRQATLIKSGNDGEVIIIYLWTTYVVNGGTDVNIFDMRIKNDNFLCYFVKNAPYWVFFNMWMKVLNEIDGKDSLGFVNPI